VLNGCGFFSQEIKPSPSFERSDVLVLGKGKILADSEGNSNFAKELRNKRF